MLRLALILGLALAPGLAAAAPWTLDPATEVSVDVPWRGSDVKVRFSGLKGQVDFDEKSPEAAKARISVAAGSAETGVGVVNALVRSEGYLDAARFPTISFQLDKLTRLSKSEARVDGRLTLRGVTKPVSFDAKVLRYGPAKTTRTGSRRASTSRARSTARPSARPAACRRCRPTSTCASAC